MSFTELPPIVFECVNLQNQPKQCVSTITMTSCGHWPWYKAYNNWSSVDADFLDWAGGVLPSLFTIKAVNTWFLSLGTEIPPKVPKLPDQLSLTLRWRSLSRWCRAGSGACFAYKGAQKYHYDFLQSIAGLIAKYTRLKMIDPPLRLILKCCIVTFCCQ
jgi:hypothetical protein